MTLDEQYQKAIDDQRAYLMQVQTDFNKICDEAKKTAQEKLKQIPDGNKEAREAVLVEQKEALDKGLHDLKVAIEVSTRSTMKALEAIVKEKEKSVLADLEKQIASL